MGCGSVEDNTLVGSEPEEEPLPPTVGSEAGLDHSLLKINLHRTVSVTPEEGVPQSISNAPTSRNRTSDLNAKTNMVNGRLTNKSEV